MNNYVTKNEVEKMIKDALLQNYRSGTPDVPPHSHNDTDGLKVQGTSIQGFQAVPSSTAKKYLNDDSGEYEYGFASINSLIPASITAGPVYHQTQYVINENAAINPIPIVVGNGVGVQGAFNGGYAPDGTVVLFETGTESTTYLYVRSRGLWYGFLADTSL